MTDSRSEGEQRWLVEGAYPHKRHEYQRDALEAIILHHAMPAGESWEDAYNEVCSIAIEALNNSRSLEREIHDRVVVKQAVIEKEIEAALETLALLDRETDDQYDEGGGQ